MRSWSALDIRFPRSPLPNLSAVASAKADPRSPLSDLVSAALMDFDCAAIEECDDTYWRVSFRDAAERDRARQELHRIFEGAGLSLASTELPDEDWATRSQQALGPVRVGRIVVTPPWLAPNEHLDDALVITILPSMGFGTGHHASTRLCLLALQGLPVADAVVLDVGTGSGILAIAAARLGAERVTALDDDPDALASARENVALNGVEGQVVLRGGDLRSEPLEPADIVLANLTGALLARAADALLASVRPGGHLVVSGLMMSEEAAVVSALSRNATVVKRAAEDEWLALTLRMTRD